MSIARPAAAIEPVECTSSSIRILPGPTDSVSPSKSTRRLSFAIAVILPLAASRIERRRPRPRAVDRHRLDDGEDGTAGREAELRERAARHPREKARPGEVDADVA